MDPSQNPDIESVVSGLNRKRNDDAGSDPELAKFSSLEKTLLPTPNGPLPAKYTMNRTKRGKVIIFNHFKFNDKNGKTRLEQRHGSDNDVKRLQDTLPKLGFCLEDIKVFPDYNEEQIFEVFTKLDSDSDLESSDCLIVVILTHGGANDELAARDRNYRLYDLIDKCNPVNLPSMAGKPKIFIVQACRGEDTDSGAKLRVVNNGSSFTQDDCITSQAGTFTYPEHADLLILMSSHYGSKAYRKHGSWLIQEFGDVIERLEAKPCSIFDILIQTNNAVAKRKTSKGLMQIPSFYSTFTKQLYFDIQNKDCHKQT